MQLDARRGIGLQRAPLGPRARLEAARRPARAPRPRRASPGAPAAAPGPSARSPAGPRRGCERRSDSSAAERSASSSSCLVCSPRSASSSSVRRIASGVRSSCEASDTKARSRLNDTSRRASISFSVRPSRPISSLAGRDGEPLARPRGGDGGGVPAHPLDRPQRRGGERVADHGGDQQRERAADGEQGVQRGRAPARAGRAAHRRPGLRCRRRRPGGPAAAAPRRPRAGARRSRRPRAPASDARSSSDRSPAPVVVSRTLPSASSTCANGSPVLAAPLPVAADDRGGVAGARGEPVVDRVVEVLRRRAG